MLIVTNPQAIDAIFEEKAPRPIRDVILEIYPDAVEDRNGRFHAPHDGYECPISGQTFRGGEYLPTEEVEDPMAKAMRAPGAGRKVPTARTLEGEVLRWSGTRGQELAVWAELIAQTKAHDAAMSHHVGEVGKMMNLEGLTLQFVKGFDGFYGTTWIHILKDSAGNVIVYKGSKRLTTGPNPYLDRDLDAGDKVSLRCKIKEHSERDGISQTVIQRPKVLAK